MSDGRGIAIEPGGRRRGRGPRLAGIALLTLFVLLLAVGSWLYTLIRASLPQLDGAVSVAGIEAEVSIERDSLGIPTIEGAGRADVAHGLGFVHAQDRFFQMDLMRRQAAGELSGLFGESAVPLDRDHRVHRFRSRAGAVLAAMQTADRVVIDAYTAGVNDGLEALGGPPWEYLLLQSAPAPWRPEDTVLAVHSMYFQLNDERALRESTRGTIRDLLGEEMLEFLAPLGDSWEAPIFGEPYPAVPVPGPEVLDLRVEPASVVPAPAAPIAALVDRREAAVVGSNNWAVAGKHTSHGGAILANDMHLPIRVPHVWYRVSLVYPDPVGGERRVTGVSLPGVPAIVAGSNGDVAWGFTNTYGDWVDLVILEPDPADPEGSYLTGDGPRPFTRREEVIRVQGGDDQTLEVLETVWGPVIGRDHHLRQRALRWIAHDPQAVSFEFARLESAGSVDEAIAIANRIGAPPQNFVVADSAGRIAWTVMGPIPRRFGHDGRVPSSWAAGDRGWDGYLEPAEYPRVVDPPSGRIWTANGRVASGPMMELIGRGTYAQSGRATQIRDRLLALDRASEADMLAIQLDDEALFLARWRELLLGVLTDEVTAADARRAELRRLVEAWGGRAAVESAGFRMVRAWRLFVAEELFTAIRVRCGFYDKSFDLFRLPAYEGPLWQLATERPPHWLDSHYSDWDGLFVAVVDATIEHFTTDGGELADRTWGERNTVRIGHPFSRAMPFLARWLDMPATALPGDSHMPRFQSPTEGASQRSAVSPGREAEGYFHMPGGQSGHPLSPHYRDSHGAWERGEATPFLPGPAIHTLTLRPATQEPATQKPQG
jgi:penicillin amidase